MNYCLATVSLCLDLSRHGVDALGPAKLQVPVHYDTVFLSIKILSDNLCINVELFCKFDLYFRHKIKSLQLRNCKKLTVSSRINMVKKEKLAYLPTSEKGGGSLC